MRAIRFRGKSKIDGEWFFGNYYDKDTKGNTHICGLNKGCLVIDPVTVGQFIGLTDINGKEIYEGDIIVQHAEDMPDIRGAVVYDEENARFGMVYTNYWESGSVTHFDTLERVKCYSDRNRELTYEVIGNVHDNPDLMLEKDINVFKCEM